MRTKHDAADMLKELALLTTLDEADPNSFRVRAYESARQALEAYPGDASRLSKAELQKLEGIGKSTAEKLLSFFATGKVDKLEGLRKKFPPPFVALLALPGLGVKGALKLRAELGVESVDDLRRAIAEHKLRDMKGYGEKSEEKLARALARLEPGGERRTPIAIARPVGERVVAELAALPFVGFAAYCGSLRRFTETIGDVDVVAATDRPADVMTHVIGMDLVGEVLVHGDKKTSVVTRQGLQIDVRAVSEAELGAALLYFTGSKGHNIKLRARCLERGYTLNEYALTELETGRVVAQRTEEEIYRALGLAFIPPVLREDQGEIELAAEGRLPPAPGPLVGDFHVHTSLSRDAHAPLEEVIRAARGRGYGLLAITEHAENLRMAGVGREQLLEQRARMAALQREVGDELRLLHGIELNIGADGELDYDAELRRSFDFCLASVHDHFDLPRERQTARILRAMEDGAVDMIGHLTARMIGSRPPIELDLDAVFDGAERHDVALEINGGLPRLDVSVDTLRAARARKVLFVATSDAHEVRELDRVENACALAHKAWLPPERIVNTWDRERVLGWIARRRGGGEGAGTTEARTAARRGHGERGEADAEPRGERRGARRGRS